MPKIKLNYFGYHPYNNPTHSERNVELPLAFWFLEKFKNDAANVIEIGEVTSFYRKPEHTIYDIAGEQPATILRDAAEIDYAGKNVLSISTIEHIGTTDYGQTPDLHRLPLVLNKMMASKNYLITFAFGYNPQLDELVKDKNYFVLERIAPTRWEQVGKKSATTYQYHSPWYAGNGLCVLTNLKDIEFEFAASRLTSVLSRCRADKWSWKNLLRAERQERQDARAAKSSSGSKRGI